MSNCPSSSSAPPALERRLKYSGPALFSYGFRPFFLFCGAMVGRRYRPLDPAIHGRPFAAYGLPTARLARS